MGLFTMSILCSKERHPSSCYHEASSSNSSSSGISCSQKQGCDLNVFASNDLGLPVPGVVGQEPWRVPPGRLVELGNGRSCFVREAGVDRGAPPLLLLHGWFASAGLNWLRAFAPLAQHYRVLAPDFRGHAQGGPSATGFAIEDCADDMGALLEALSPQTPAIVIGYSLGGMVAQEVWRRHADRVAGLVLGATSSAPVLPQRGRNPFARGMQMAHSLSRQLHWSLDPPRRLAEFIGGLLRSPRGPSESGSEAGSEAGAPSRGDAGLATGWPLHEFMGHHWPTLLDAGRAIAEFDTRSWIADVDVPTTVLVTARDRLVPPEQQRDLAARIAGARIETIDAGHLACMRADFGPRLLRGVRAIERAMA